MSFTRSEKLHIIPCTFDNPLCYSPCILPQRLRGRSTGWGIAVLPESDCPRGGGIRSRESSRGFQHNYLKFLISTIQVQKLFSSCFLRHSRNHSRYPGCLLESLAGSFRPFLSLPEQRQALPPSPPNRHHLLDKADRYIPLLPVRDGQIGLLRRYHLLIGIVWVHIHTRCFGRNANLAQSAPSIPPLPPPQPLKIHTIPLE